MNKKKLANILDNKQLKKIIAILSKHTKVYIVGGYVRDYINKQTRSCDIDLAVECLNDKIAQDFVKKTNMKILDNALKYNVLTVFGNGIEITITELRKDLDSDGRHAITAKASNLKEDASRRDFTINALYVDESGNLFDFFNGINDLQYSRVVFIGDPKKRIQEDYLRIIRFFRFSAYICPKISNDYDDIIQENAPNILANVSKERISNELNRLILGEFAESSFISMNKLGVISNIFSCSKFEKMPKFIFNMAKKIAEISLSPIAIVFIMQALNNQKINIAECGIVLRKNDKKFLQFMIDNGDFEKYTAEKLIIMIIKNKDHNFIRLIAEIYGRAGEVNDLMHTIDRMPLKPLDLINLSWVKKDKIREIMQRSILIWCKSSNADKSFLIKELESIYRD